MHGKNTVLPFLEEPNKHRHPRNTLPSARSVYSVYFTTLRGFFHPYNRTDGTMFDSSTCVLSVFVNTEVKRTNGNAANCTCPR